MHLNCQLVFIKYALPMFKDGMKVLEIGSTSNSSILKQIINNDSIQYTTLDIDSKYIGEIDKNHINSLSEYDYPIENESFDIVLSNQVMEHVKDIWRWFNELKRITKKDGLIITISPISWVYHEAPVDCWRIYPEGMKALMDKIGLDVILNQFECLEKDFIPKSTPTIPGKSSFKLDGTFIRRIRFIIFYNKLLSIIPYSRIIRVPLPICFDNICISKKTFSN